jgi:hypothetical protein
MTACFGAAFVAKDEPEPGDIKEVPTAGVRMHWARGGMDEGLIQIEYERLL